MGKDNKNIMNEDSAFDPKGKKIEKSEVTESSEQI